MARLLLKAVDAVHPDADIDTRGCYKVGDVVAIREDGHTWGGKECLPTFLQLDISGVSAASLDYLQRSDEETSVDVTFPALRRISRLARGVVKNKPRETKIRRRYQLNVAEYTFIDGHASVGSLVTQHNKRK